MFDRLAGDHAAARVLAQAQAVLGADPRSLAAGDAFVNRIAQPLVCTAALAGWAALAPQLPRPRLFAGYSVGELAAYGCAGALGVEDTLRLAMARAACMDAASADAAGGLVAVRGLPRSRIDALCAEFGAVVAIINGPQHFVLGAPVAVLERIEPAATARGAARVLRLPVAVPAHTPWLRPAGVTFTAALERSALSDPPLPVLAGVSGMPVRSRAAAIAALGAQLSTPVDWAAGMQAAWELGARVFLELGPGSALTHIARELLPQAAARALDDFRTLGGASEWVNGALAEQ
ncbi:MAG: acyltransferase domain-containing protein [Chromatiales bacterium]|nr:acyltransferase domain-containing protein [Chromatiales bacterium]